MKDRSTTAEGQPPLILIVGPTAVGKTEIAIQLAEKMNGEIISADSRLFYRGMDIGTAKPTLEEQARVPHHLIDVANPDETWSLAQFQQSAQAIIADIHARGKLPFLVGGTGQYVRAVSEGWSPPEVKPDERLRGELEKMRQEKGNSWLHEKLGLLDPEAAEKIDPRNVRRTIRALEVILTTGRRFSSQRGQAESPYQAHHRWTDATSPGIVCACGRPHRVHVCRGIRGRGAGSARERLLSGTTIHVGHRLSGMCEYRKRSNKRGAGKNSGETRHAGVRPQAG